MWFTGIIFEILFSFYTLNAFLVEKPHRYELTIGNKEKQPIEKRIRQLLQLTDYYLLY